MVRIKTWVLIDSKTGNANQAIALAEKLMSSGAIFEYKTIKLSYQLICAAPNLLLWLFAQIMPLSFFLQASTVQKMHSMNLPNLIITSGRKPALISYFLKKMHGNIKLVQIMKPEICHEVFDFIILPQHDQAQNSKNVIKILGALINFEPKHIKNMNGSISVIIGGNAKKYKFTDSTSEDLASILTDIANKYHKPLNITYSRRTPDNLKKAINAQLGSKPNVTIHELADRDTYLGMLSSAEFIITTADSISMCSEALATGIPVYIFSPKDLKSKKHLAFYNRVLELGIAKKLDVTASLEYYEYHALNELDRITKILQKHLENEIM